MPACHQLTLPHATLHAGTPVAHAAHQHVETQVTWRLRLDGPRRGLPRAWIVPSGMSQAAVAQPLRRSVVVQLAPALLALTADELLGTPAVELVGGAVRDQALRHLGATIAAEFELAWRDTLLLDALTYVVAGQLVRGHARPLGRGADVPAPRRLDAAQLARLRALVIERFEQPPTVAEMAAAVGLSPHRLGQALKATAGVGPHGYVTRLRVERARHLLRTARGAQTLSDIALRLGFCSQSHFTAVFHRNTGTTPGVYRAHFVELPLDTPLEW
jgi:AraC family transcriptional regulator